MSSPGLGLAMCQARRHTPMPQRQVGPDSFWFNGGNGSELVDESLEDLDGTDKAKFKWDDGPIIGSAAYQAASGYVSDMDVNVVRVDVTVPAAGVFNPDPNLPRDKGTGTLNDGTIGYGVSGRTAGGASGITWSAIVTLTGRKGGRGIDHIKTGFIQTVTDVKWQGRYLDNTVLDANVEGLTPLNDWGIDLLTNADMAPWYRIAVPSTMFTGSRLQSDLAYKVPTCTKTIQSSDGLKLRSH